MRKKWALVAPTALALMFGGFAVAPAAQAAAACTYQYQQPDVTLESTAAVYKDYGKVTVTVQVSNDCGTVTGVTTVLNNTSTGNSTPANLSLLVDGPIQTWRTDVEVYNFPYGKFTVGTVKVDTLNGNGQSYSENFTPNPAVTVINRSETQLSNPDPATQSVNSGDSVALTGWLYTYYNYSQGGYPDEDVHLQVQAAGSWTTVATTKTVDNSFSFIYTPTHSEVYRFAYSQTDWATGAVSTAGVLNFVSASSTQKPPSAPPAFVSATTSNSISLNWSVPADPNGTITGYRFGWSTPSGKPVPAWEDTYGPNPSDPFVFTNLAPATDYTVWVEAVNANGRSARTSILVATKGAAVPPPVIQPPPVQPPVVKPPVVKPPVKPHVSVYVASVSKKGKLYVDVNPNRRGKQFYTFIVQKKRGVAWENYPNYHTAFKTRGKKETRTLNFKKGTYRVVVFPKYGYRGTVSKAVYLRK